MTFIDVELVINVVIISFGGGGGYLAFISLIPDNRNISFNCS